MTNKEHQIFRLQDLHDLVNKQIQTSVMIDRATLEIQPVKPKPKVVKIPVRYE